jgi:putative glycosyltransferase (TIGR04372 family)
MLSFILNQLNKIKIFPYYFLTPTPYALGTAVMEIFITLQNIKKKKLIILKVNIANKILNYKICNRSLFDNLYEKNYIFIPSNFIKNFLVIFLTFEFFLKRSFILITKFSLKIKYDDFTHFLNIGLPLFVSFRNSFNHNLDKLKFSDIKIREKKLKLNIEKNICILLKKKLSDYIFFKNRPYVVLHVRDGNYRNDHKRRPWRNNNINNYSQSVDYLISKGFSVIKIGDKESNKLDFKNKFYFDYSSSKLRSEEMDLYIIKNCNFLMANCSGPEYLAFLFSKPILITNAYVIPSLFRSTDRVFFKKILFEGNEMSIIDYLSLPFEIYFREYNHKEISFIENSQHEILEATKEFSKLYFSNFNIKPTSIQKKFNNLIYKRSSLFFSDEATHLKNIDPVANIYLMKTFKAYFFDCYLKNHFKKFKFLEDIKIKQLSLLK